MPNNTMDTWPCLLSTCSNPHIKGLRIARHNKAVDQISHTLQSNKYTRYYKVINADNQNFRPQDNTLPQWLLQCTCPSITCACLAILRIDILGVLGASRDTQPPITQTPTNVIRFIEFTYCHDIFPNTAHNEKTAKYNSLVQTLKIVGWQVNPLITIIAGVRGAIHEQTIKKLEKLKIAKNEIKRLMEHLHQIAIKYLTYLMLNKRKLDNKQPPIDSPLVAWQRVPSWKL